MTWNLNLKRANNHKCATLSELQKILKPIKDADEAERKTNDKTNKDGGGNRHQHEKRGNGGGGDQLGSSGDKPCRKPGNNHKWKDYPDN